MPWGEFSNDASYMAAIAPVVLDYNLVHEWDYELIVGTVADIRTHVWNIGKPATGPDYAFSASREGWHYQQATDGGWPVNGKLRVTLTDQMYHQIKSPDVFWPGNDNPKLYVRAAFQTQNNLFRLGWRVPGETTILDQPNRQIDFPIINDGLMHTYEIVLKDHAGWKNQSINQILLQPIPDGPPINGWTEIDWIAPNADGPTERLSSIAGLVPCEPGGAPLSVSQVRYVRAVR